jgi:hypothetical protein
MLSGIKVLTNVLRAVPGDSIHMPDYGCGPVTAFRFPYAGRKVALGVE